MSESKWIAAMKAKGHSPMLDEDGDVNFFAMEFDIHNGPGCSICGAIWCEHCTKPDDIPACNCIEGKVIEQ